MRGWDEIRRLPRAIWLLNLANVVNRMGTMAFLFLGLYLTKHLGYPAKVAGALLGLFGLGSLIITPFGGWLCDHFGSKRVLVTSLATSGLLLILFPLFHSLPLLFIMTLILAVVSEVGGPAIMTYSTATIPPDLRKASIALNRLSHNLGMSVGPVIGGVLAAISFKWVFWVDGITTLISAAILLPFLPNIRVAAEQEVPPFFKNLGLLSRDRTLCYFLLACIPMGIAWFQVSTSLPIFLVKNLGLTEAQFGFLFTINTIMIVIMEVPLTVRISHWSSAKTLALAASLFGLGYGILVFSQGYAGAIVMMVVITFGEMLMAPSGANYVSEISPRGREGSYMGIYTASFSLCSLLAPLLGTWVYDAFGGRALWVGGFVFGGISAILYLRVKPANLQARAQPVVSAA